MSASYIESLNALEIDGTISTTNNSGDATNPQIAKTKFETNGDLIAGISVFLAFILLRTGINIWTTPTMAVVKLNTKYSSTMPKFVQDVAIKSIGLGRSKAHPILFDIAKQLRIGIRLGMCPLHFPDRQRLVADAHFQQGIVGNIRHFQLGRNKPAAMLMLNHGNVGIAIGAVGMTRSAAKQNRACIS